MRRNVPPRPRSPARESSLRAAELARCSHIFFAYRCRVAAHLVLCITSLNGPATPPCLNHGVLTGRYKVLVDDPQAFHAICNRSFDTSDVRTPRTRIACGGHNQYYVTMKICVEPWCAVPSHRAHSWSTRVPARFVVPFTGLSSPICRGCLFDSSSALRGARSMTDPTSVCCYVPSFVAQLFPCCRDLLCCPDQRMRRRTQVKRSTQAAVSVAISVEQTSSSASRFNMLLNCLASTTGANARKCGSPGHQGHK